MLNILRRIYFKRQVYCAYQDIIDCKIKVAINSLMNCHFLSGTCYPAKRKVSHLLSGLTKNIPQDV